MKRLILVINGKGGVGKSTFATQLIQLYKDLRARYRAVDTDNENSTLKRFHKDADFLSVDSPQGLGLIFELLKTTETVIVDCRTASTDLIMDYFEEVSVFDLLRDFGARMTTVMLVNHDPDSIEQLRVISGALGNRCDYVVVRNQVHSEHFVLYDKSRIRVRLLQEFQAREITMPKLYDWLVIALNERGFTIPAAMASREFTLIDRQRLLNWWRSVIGEIHRAGNFLVPETSAESALVGDAGTHHVLSEIAQ